MSVSPYFPHICSFNLVTLGLASMASILWVPAAFLSFSSLLYWLSSHLPALENHAEFENTTVSFPSNLDELRSLASLLSAYRTTHFMYVLSLFSVAYIFKQTFAIPGSVFLNLLGGALLGKWLGFLLTCILSATGATCCFLLAKLCGKEYIIKYFPHYLNTIQKKIEENLDSLFFFLLFLRLFPMTPNWFLNMASPMCGVPVHLFFLSVFVGLMPYNFLTVHTGCLLSEVSSMDSIFSWWTILKLFGIANAALLPGVLIKHYHDQRTKVKTNKSL